MRGEKHTAKNSLQVCTIFQLKNAVGRTTRHKTNHCPSGVCASSKTVRRFKTPPPPPPPPPSRTDWPQVRQLEVAIKHLKDVPPGWLSDVDGVPLTLLHHSNLIRLHPHSPKLRHQLQLTSLRNCTQQRNISHTKKKEHGTLYIASTSIPSLRKTCWQERAIIILTTIYYSQLSNKMKRVVTRLVREVDHTKEEVSIRVVEALVSHGLVAGIDVHSYSTARLDVPRPTNRRQAL